MKALDRRTFLRGVGASIGLPFLDAMTPAFAAPGRAAHPPCRLMFVYAPTGVIPLYWFPETTGANFDFPRTVKPLEKFRGDVLFVSNLAHHNSLALGDGPGDHARAAATYLTGMHIKKTEGADLRDGISADQIAARKFAAQTRFPSLELTCEDSRQAGACDSYSCAYQNMSWKSETQPLPPEMNPRQVFERLFGDLDRTADPAARARQRSYRQSILDITLRDTERLENNLGATDKRKLDEYLGSIREVEIRIERAEQDAAVPPGFEKPAGIPTTFAEHAQLMFSLVRLAFQADLTRVATFMLAREGGVRTYPEIGVPEAHHSCSHHRGDPVLIEKVAKVSDYHAQQFAWFVEKLKSTREGDGTLLDHSAVTYGAALGDPNIHDHIHLPTLIAGRANGRIKSGRHVRYPEGTPMSNLHLSLLDLAGVPTETLGDATGKLDYIADLI
ncbi:MAG: DUF1552 domain-containing protein [Bryobacteraceae bacterium]|jgi:hypothetical protein